MFGEIKHFIYWALKAKPSGFKIQAPDPRNFLYSKLMGGSYTPKHTVKINKTLSVKDQSPYNTCQWNSAIVAKEPDEGVVLSVRLMVAKAVKMGLVSGDGFSALESGPKVLRAWGAVEEGTVREKESPWGNYIKLSPDSYDLRAEKHKIASSWFINAKEEMLKVIDEGRLIESAKMWYSKYNQGGGFSYPWIIRDTGGYKVGGHSTVIKGYVYGYKGIDLNRKLVVGAGGTNVVVFQNHYSEKWGASFYDLEGNFHQGCYFVDMDFFIKNNLGMVVTLDDIDKELGKLINKYDGQDVKKVGAPGIYHIQAGQKKLYPDWETFLAWNGDEKRFVEIEGEEAAALDRMKEGDNMDITKTDHWDFLKKVEKSNRIAALMEKLKKEVKK